MALTAGTRLGRYEIQSSLGVGGMGEVYRATDTNLGRDIALKVLPAEMAQDPERLGRLRREAKTLAQLDHPNIVTIHFVEDALSAHSWVAPYNVAVIYAGLGDRDQAFALLERAYQNRSYYMPSFLTMDERLDHLHSDPRYAALPS